MALDLDGDLDVFFNTDEFANQATYTPKGGVARPITVIFDDAFLNVQGLVDVGVSSTNPVARAKTADLLNGGSAGETLVINAVTYTIRDKQPDGTGVTLLEFKKS